MEELIRRISRDHEPYEVDKADPVIIQSLSGRTLSEDEINQLNAKEQTALKEGMRQFSDTQAACLNDIVVRKSCKLIFCSRKGKKWDKKASLKKLTGMP